MCVHPISAKDTFRLDRSLDHRGLARPRALRRVRGSRNKLPSPKKLKTRNRRMHPYFFALMVPGNKRVTHKVKPCVIKESKATTQGEFSQLWAKREGDTLQCEKKFWMRMFLKLIATLWKLGKISGLCLVKLPIATKSCP